MLLPRHSMFNQISKGSIILLACDKLVIHCRHLELIGNLLDLPSNSMVNCDDVCACVQNTYINLDLLQHCILYIG